MKLSHLMIFVPDLGRARTWYEEALGLSFVRELEDGMRMKCGRQVIDLFACKKPGRVGDYARESRTVFVFAVPSLAREMKRLRRLGVSFIHKKPGEFEFGRYAAFSDPFGNVHEIFERT